MSVVFSTFGGRIVAENRGGVIRQYVPDNLGSTVALIDTGGTVTDTYDYWPYGEERVHTGSSTTPFTFCGALGYFKDFLDMLYVRARHLRVDLTQWMTIDRLWPRQTAYQYAVSCPTLYFDPSGAFLGGDTGIAIGVGCLAGGLFGGISGVLFNWGKPPSVVACEGVCNAAASCILGGLAGLLGSFGAEGLSACLLGAAFGYAGSIISNLCDKICDPGYPECQDYGTKDVNCAVASTIAGLLAGCANLGLGPVGGPFGGSALGSLIDNGCKGFNEGWQQGQEG
ncbi:MAG TPA: hypothetical protein VKT78_09315 [Fimbriimonadaceae bacterium]|nr:hypothetical protein [Fimbriimonadaceae bacterium]